MDDDWQGDGSGCVRLGVKFQGFRVVSGEFGSRGARVRDVR